MSDDLVNVMNVLLLIENGLDEKLAQRVSAQWKAKCEELFTLRARVREVVGPFAEAAADICEQSSDDAHIWEAPCAMNITRGHLRAARQLMEDLK